MYSGDVILFVAGRRQLARNLSGGIQELDHRFSVRSYLDDETRPPLWIVQTKCDRLCGSASESEALRVETSDAYALFNHGRARGVATDVLLRFAGGRSRPRDRARYTEPFFLTFNAETRLGIAMTPEDLGRSNFGSALQEVG
jgi:hypothetical protein